MHKTRRRFLSRSALWLSTSSFLLTQIQSVLARGNDPALQGMRRISGNVRINDTAAQEGMLVLPGDTVTTGPGAQAIYVVGKDAFLQRESSSVSFAQSALRVISGKLLSVFGKGEKQITVPTATIGIRGTACYIETSGDGAQARTYFCLCYGTAEIQPNIAPSHVETITTRHHDKPQWIYNDPSMPNGMADASVINHTDAELQMLEALVGRVPPFIQDGYGGGRY